MPSHLVAAVTAAVYLPQQIVVPGDDTEVGQRYGKTFANDHRAKLDWSDKHELQVLHLLSSSTRRSQYCVPAEPLSVFLVNSDSGTLHHDSARFDLVTDDGRQRRRDGMVLNDRLRKISEEYKPHILDGTLYEALTKPGHKPAWLTATFAEELATGPWFNADGSPCLLAFRIDVVAENPDLGDPAILLDNVRRKEASIPTPLPALAKQYTSLLGAKRNGTLLFPHITKLAEKIGKSPQHVRSVLDYEKLDPMLKDAVDKQTIGLGLAVVGPYCIAFVTVDGEKKPLPCEAQVAVYKELAATYAVELDDGIPDNKTTRKGIALIKERLGFGSAKTVAKTVAPRAVVATAAKVAVAPPPGRSPEATPTADEASVPSSTPRPIAVSPPTPAPQRLDQLRTLAHPTVMTIVAFLDGKTTLAAVEATLSTSNVPAKTKAEPIVAPTPTPVPASVDVLSSPFAREELATREILDLLDAAERDVGDLRTVPVGDFEKLLLSHVAHTITDHAVAKLRSVIAAYSKPSTRRHVDIGVHVREMLTE